MRPYSGPSNKTRRGPYHDFAWRGWWDFGTGAIGDMACHTGNMAFMALKLEHPTHVSAEAGDVNDETCPSFVHAIDEVPRPREARAGHAALVRGQEGRQEADAAARSCASRRSRSIPTSGEDEAGRQRLDPRRLEGHRLLAGRLRGRGLLQHRRGGQQQLEARNVPESTTAATRARRTSGSRPSRPASRRLALSNFDYAGLLTAAFLLGNVAVRTGKPFTWDGEKCMATELQGRRQVHPPRVPQGLGPDRLQRIVVSSVSTSGQYEGRTLMGPRSLVSSDPSTSGLRLADLANLAHCHCRRGIIPR